MKSTTYNFSSGDCTIYSNASFDSVRELVPGKIVFITDRNVYDAHKDKFGEAACIVLPAGETQKQQATINDIIGWLIEAGADRKTFIVAVGGGVITDIAGYAASIYMRGLSFGFIPTSVLAMVDAAIGGKNGIDVGLYKNMVGIIRQPKFLLYDTRFLSTLPDEEWVNGFAEIIKHACIKDAGMFQLLEQHTIADFKADENLLSQVIAQNVSIKTKVVLADEFEQGERRLLNFGHTIGHAIENMQELPHGHAVSIGMVAAAKIAAMLTGFDAKELNRLIALLQRYGLPTTLSADREKLFTVMQSDKKRSSDTMNFILLNRIGEATVKPIGLADLKILIEKL